MCVCVFLLLFLLLNCFHHARWFSPLARGRVGHIKVQLPLVYLNVSALDLFFPVDCCLCPLDVFWFQFFVVFIFTLYTLTDIHPMPCIYNTFSLHIVSQRICGPSEPWSGGMVCGTGRGRRGERRFSAPPSVPARPTHHPCWPFLICTFFRVFIDKVNSMENIQIYTRPVYIPGFFF